MKKITMEHVAKALNVSAMTVSKAFQNSPDISQSMRRKVFEAAKAVGYVYPKKKRTNIIVLSKESFLSKGDTFYNELFFRLNEQSQAFLCQISLTVVKDTDALSFIQDFDLSHFDGVALMGQFHRDFLLHLELNQVPFICIDFYEHGIAADMILSNNFIASYEATAHLLNHGHERIHFIGTLNATSSINDRYFGYCKAMTEFSCEAEIKSIDDRNGHGLKVQFDLEDHYPTAFVCNNDHTAYLLIQQLHSKGLKVPEDISVMGFDDVSYSRDSKPTISTMRVSRTYMAEQALSILMMRINDTTGNHFKKISLDCSLIERDSTGPNPEKKDEL